MIGERPIIGSGNPYRQKEEPKTHPKCSILHSEFARFAIANGACMMGGIRGKSEGICPPPAGLAR